MKTFRRQLPPVLQRPLALVDDATSHSPSVGVLLRPELDDAPWYGDARAS